MTGDERVLKIERVLKAPRGAVWRCWTEIELLKRWFCPHPWRLAEAAIDLRPGGRMNTVMEGPDGARMERQGVWLEIVEGRKLTFTDVYTEGFIPSARPFMTGFVELSDAPDGATHMVWGARHASDADLRKHLEMGFERGGGAAAAQLDELAQRVAAQPGGALRFGARTRTCLLLPDQAEEAARFYVSLLPDSRIEEAYRPTPDAPALVTEFTLQGAPYMTLTGDPHPEPSARTSISVLTKDQAETDRLWAALTADVEDAGRCGWLKDRYGVFWRIVPEALPRLTRSGDPAAAARVQLALRSMGKIDVAALEAAHRG